MPDEANKQHDRWSRLESLAKVAAGFGTALGAILIPVMISSYTEESKRAQVYMQIMTEREKKDTEIREKMFEALIKDYLGTANEISKKDVSYGLSLRRDLVLLELLTTNFQEFFDTAPIAKDIYERLVRYRGSVLDQADKREAMKLESKLIRVVRDIASRQAARINTFGSSAFVSVNVGNDSNRGVCVRLYTKEEMTHLFMPDGVTRIGAVSDEACHLEKQERGLTSLLSTSQKGHSLQIKLISATQTAVEVEVHVYADEFKGGRLIASLLHRAMPAFYVSYFDLPYLDNTKLADGSRFALVLRNLDTYKDVDGAQITAADLEVLRFKKTFVTLRDRPEFEEMLRQLTIEP